MELFVSRLNIINYDFGYYYNLNIERVKEIFNFIFIVLGRTNV